MVTSFADGTKVSFEQALVANATGMSIEQRGMRGTHHPGHVDDLVNAYDIDMLLDKGGIVDYVVGSKPGPGVFVLASHSDPKQKHYLNLYKLGEGPLYSFYTPYHLCHFEVPLSIARAFLFNDPTIQPLENFNVEVIAKAKRNIKRGSKLDGLGGFDTFGITERADITAKNRLLPMGIAENCIARHDIIKDTVLTYNDIILPTGRLVDQLRIEQQILNKGTT